MLGPTIIEHTMAKKASKRRGNGEGTVYYEEKRGKWLAEFIPPVPGGKRRRFRANRQADAIAWLTAQRDQVAKGLLVADDALTLGDYLGRFMRDVGAHTLRPRTREVYSYLIRQHIRPVVGAIRLARLRPDQVQALYTQKLSEGLSPRTVRFIHSVLHRSLESAVRWSLVPRNVCDLVDPPKPRRPEPVVWNLENARRFLVAIAGRYYAPIYVLALTTGMRIGEVLGVHREDIDWEAGKVSVRHAVQAQQGKGLVVVEPKSDSARRSIPLPRQTVGILRRYAQGKQGNQGLLFTTRSGKPISPRNVVRDFHEVLAEQALPRIRFHDLRHTYATLQITAGTHMKVLQATLGHSSIVLTGDTYAHVLPEMSDGVARNIETMLGGSLGGDTPDEA